MSAFGGSLDANVLLRFLLDDLPDQRQQVGRLLVSTDKQFAVADTAIIEVAFVLSRPYAMARADIVELVTSFMEIPQINCNRALFDLALPLYEKHPALTLEDCCLAVYAKLNNAAPLYTFDQKLARQVPGTQLIA